MKKIVASVGLVAVGAASIQAQYAPNLTPQELAKPWSLSASLRGFYDDNYLTQPSTYPNPNGVGFGHPLSSYGTEFSPAATINHSTEDTLMSASYLYDLKWYAFHEYLEQSHQLNGRFEHQFSEKYRLSVADSFVVAQEPTLIEQSGLISNPLLASGNNVHNTGSIGFSAELTKLFDLHLGYANNLYAYRQVGGDETALGPNGNIVAAPYTYASRSASLDRIEQLATIDLRWKALPDTTGVLGYQYGHTDYTSPEYIIYPNSPGEPAAGFLAKTRNSDQDFLYVGADHSFTPDVNGSIRVGGEYLDYNNLPHHTSKGSPYVDLSLTDQYLPRCTAQVGVKHIHSSTDVVGAGGTGTPVLDSDTTAAYFTVNHEVTDRFTVTGLGQAQFSSFNGGGVGFSGKGEDFFIAGINATYHFNPFVSAETGYNYSKLNSDLPDRGYTRNFLYLGVRATY